jgi:hypothetical protein
MDSYVKKTFLQSIILVSQGDERELLMVNIAKETHSFDATT